MVRNVWMNPGNGDRFNWLDITVNFNKIILSEFGFYKDKTC